MKVLIKDFFKTEQHLMNTFNNLKDAINTEQKYGSWNFYCVEFLNDDRTLYCKFYAKTKENLIEKFSLIETGTRFNKESFESILGMHIKDFKERNNV